MFLITGNFFPFKFAFFVLISLNIAFSHGARKHGNKNNYHVLDFNSMWSKPNCSAHKSVRGSHTMRLFHVHGPCSPFANSGRVPSAHEILVMNEARVKWLNARNSNSHTTSMDESEAKSMEDVHTMGDGRQYYITIGLGTPKVDYHVMIDTGSDLTWVLCKGCIEGCDSTRSLFDPSKSLTYKNISVEFQEKYGDESFITGYMNSDKLTLEPNDVINQFRFGCAVSNKDKYTDNFITGLLGLGLGRPDSFVSQSASNFGKKIFGYCLSDPNKKNGYLYFGDEAERILESPLKFTPLLSESQYYSLRLVGISVAGKKLNVPSTVFTSKKTIIDSGTVVTHLPSMAYEALSSAFKQSMSIYQPAPKPEDEVLDTCFNVQRGQNIIVPPVTFTFDGDIDVDLHPSGIGWTSKDGKKWCLAFTKNGNEDDMTIIGNTQQREMEVLYDLDHGRIGFGKTGCAK